MKYNVSQYQLILAAAMLKCTVEAAKTVSDLSEKQLRIRHQDMNKFMLWVFNHLSEDCKISDSQAARCLLDLPDYYTLQSKIWHLNLHHFWNQFEHIAMPEPGVFEGGDEPARVITVKKTFSSLFDHYYWHGSQLIEFCLYEYFKLVTVKSNTLTSDIHFLSEHFNYETHVQSYSEKQSADTFTVILTDSLLKNQALENSICSDHSETMSM